MCQRNVELQALSHNSGDDIPILKQVPEDEHESLEEMIEERVYEEATTPDLKNSQVSMEEAGRQTRHIMFKLYIQSSSICYSAPWAIAASNLERGSQDTEFFVMQSFPTFTLIQLLWLQLVQDHNQLNRPRDAFSNS